jgi:hypothetical protein
MGTWLEEVLHKLFNVALVAIFATSLSFTHVNLDDDDEDDDGDDDVETAQVLRVKTQL